MKHLGTNQELKTVIVELTEDDVQVLMACVNAAEIRWGAKGKNYKIAAKEAAETWSKLYEISVKLG